MKLIPQQIIMLEALIGVVGTILGTILGSLLTVALARFSTRHTITVDLMKYIASAEHYYVLQVMWDLRNAWQQDDGKLLVNHFIQSPNLRTPEESCHLNSLTDHQHLDIYLRFLSQVVYYYEKNIIDRELFEIVFIDHYSWYLDFIEEFVEVFEKRKLEFHDISPLPSWVEATKKISIILRLHHQEPRRKASFIDYLEKSMSRFIPARQFKKSKQLLHRR
ncbi:hypothetical protein ACN4EK_02115 [Pantanalinema rosaneae CENA516]|uniref:hypothetical protein n=1 Tax=Pantanalinema rosaneae TaxID=1620701 RepID=UPI003D6F66C3